MTKGEIMAELKKLWFHEFKDSMDEWYLVSGFLESNLTHLTAEITRLREALEEGKTYDIDFDGNVKVRIKFANNSIHIYEIMNGYGDPIPPERIKIEDFPPFNPLDIK